MTINSSKFNLTQTDEVEDAAFYSDLLHALEDAGSDLSETPYGAKKTAELKVQFAMDPTYGLSKKRYGWFSNETLFDDTFFTETGGKIEMETGASTGDIARLRSAFPGQYTAHTLSEPGIGARIPSEHLEYDDNGYVSLTHGEISIELAQWDADAGSSHTSHGISYNSDGVYHRVRANGQNIEFTPQSEWNIDKMDGTGPSETVLRPERGYVYIFAYTWYGEGAYILAVQDSRTMELFPLHIYPAVDDALPAAVDSPNMPISVSVQNHNTAEPLKCRVGGMQYATQGGAVSETDRKTQEARQTGSSYIDTEIVVDSDDAIDPFAEPGVPLVSIRRDENSLRAKEGLKLEIQDVFVNADSDIYIFVFDEYNPSTALAGSNFGQPTSVSASSESQAVTDTAATAYTPSQDAVLRGMSFVSSTKDNAINITGDARANVPLRGTSIITAALAQGSNNTGAEPAILEVNERY